MMNVNNGDELCTRWLIMEAFTELLGDNPCGKISVQSIVRKTGISRSTFYLHFQDKMDLLHQLTEHIIGEFLDLFEKFEDAEMLLDMKRLYSQQQPSQHVVDICEHIRIHRKFYCNRFQDPVFINELSERLSCRLMLVYEDETHGVFTAYGIVGCMSRWLIEGLKGSTSDIALKMTSVTLLPLPEFRKHGIDLFDSELNV